MLREEKLEQETAQLLLEPLPDRRIESDFSPLRDLPVRIHRRAISFNMCLLRIALQAIRHRERCDVLHEIVIAERCPHFQAVRHAHAVHVRDVVTPEVAIDVQTRRPRQQAWAVRSRQGNREERRRRTDFPPGFAPCLQSTRPGHPGKKAHPAQVRMFRRSIRSRDENASPALRTCSPGSIPAIS